MGRSTPHIGTLLEVFMDHGVSGLLHFFSRWLPLAIILPFRLLLEAALRQYTSTITPMET
nr:hypothetical protein Iba_chr08bCG7590 [Ipomoea batatas]